MLTPNREILNHFTIDTLPDLDIAVLGALELCIEEELPKFDFSSCKRPLIVGSGNAEATGKILGKDMDAVFASESNYEEKLINIHDIDTVILLSASGEKHAPIIAKKAKELGKNIIFITNTKDSSASKELRKEEGDKEYVLPKNREPYTYNTSTYMSIMLASTGESPKDIYAFIQEKIAGMDFSQCGEYDRFYIIVPSEFSEIIRMLNVKFIELFGRTVARDIETKDYVAHATTVVASNELFISFGEENALWGKEENRLYIPLPENAGYVAMMAIGYYVVAQIQKRRAPLFKENLVAYMEEVSKIFGHELKAIVE